MQRLEIQLSRIKIALLLTGALAFVALGAWLFFRPPGFGLKAQLAGAAAVLFFGLCAVYAAIKFFDRKPGLVLDTLGIMDNSSAIAAGFIPWGDIVGFRIGKVERQRFLTILVVNPDAYLLRASPMRRALGRMNIGLTGSPLNISANALRIDFDELVATVQDFHRQATG